MIYNALINLRYLVVRGAATAGQVVDLRASRGLQAMHRTIYPILPDTGRRLGEIVGVKIGCIEVIDGQHNLVYTTTRSPDCIDACPLPPTSSRPGSVTARG